MVKYIATFILSCLNVTLSIVTLRLKYLRLLAKLKIK